MDECAFISVSFISCPCVSFKMAISGGRGLDLNANSLKTRMNIYGSDNVVWGLNCIPECVKYV